MKHVLRLSTPEAEDATAEAEAEIAAVTVVVAAAVAAAVTAEAEAEIAAGTVAAGAVEAAGEAAGKSFGFVRGDGLCDRERCSVASRRNGCSDRGLLRRTTPTLMLLNPPM